MATRKEVALGLRKAADSYWLKKGFACHHELGIVKWGKYRADIIAINLKTEIIVCEIKSCVSDFSTDDKKGKWLEYLQVCNRFYFVFTEETSAALERHFVRFKELGCGVLILDKKTGYLRSRLPAKWKPLSGPVQKMIATRMAWRAADISKRTNRRQRIYLD